MTVSLDHMLAPLNEKEREIIDSYRPYQHLDSFWVGYRDYGRTYTNPFEGGKCYNAQAWDRGLEAAMRIERGKTWNLQKKSGR